MYNHSVIQTNFVGFINGFSTQPPSGGGGNGGGGGGNNPNSGDMRKNTYDVNFNDIVDLAENAIMVNGKQVQLDVDNVPVSPLEASDDWDSI